MLKLFLESKGNAVHYLLVGLVAGLCYVNSLDCGFVFDDMSAVRDNRDLRPGTPWSNLFFNDFWGTPIHKEHSHKSYRPLCVFTFRLNYLIHELEPWGYHLINVFLHSLVCLLFLKISLLFLPGGASFLAALLFAVHPIHTEAVTGVVGRAECLSSVFFLLSFLCYTRCASRYRDWLSLAGCVILMVMATLCKEQGITVIGVCWLYELFVAQRLRVPDMWQTLLNVANSRCPPLWLREMGLRLVILTAGGLAVLFARVKVMGAQLPVFTKFDNPAAASSFPSRHLTFAYLFPINVGLLLYPLELCCDWTMGTIPLVKSLGDMRNLATLSLLICLAALAWIGLTSEEPHGRVVLMSLGLMVFPFLPAANVFFPVGFVVAERVLYTPSMGYCLLVAAGAHLLLQYSKIVRSQVLAFLVVLLCLHAYRTVDRNWDWKNEHTIFLAGLKVNQNNAKLYNNVGHALEAQGNHTKALEYFLKASRVQPDDIGAHINVGRTHTNLQRFEEAEQAFRKAKALLPHPRGPGAPPYQARVAPNHLHVFLNLANLISRNGSRLEEADALYRQAISMRADYIQAYINRGDILIKLNRTREAQDVYERALQFDNVNPDIYYNLGVVFLEQGKAAQALAYFDKALELEPYHEQALLNSAVLIQEGGNPGLRPLAYTRLRLLLSRGKVNDRVFFNLAMLAMDDKHMDLAEDWFKTAIELREDFRSALFNLALLLSDLKRPLEAVPFLQQLLKHHPDHVKGLILLGDIYINHMKDLDSAQQCYEKILALEPANVQALHNLCVVLVERGLLSRAEGCLKKAQALAPNEAYIHRHLRIVQARLTKLNSAANLTTTGSHS